MGTVSRSGRSGIAVCGWALALVLAACAQGGATSAVSCAGLASSPGTRSGGLIAIITDHGTYARNANLIVTVTNTTSESVYAPDHAASCSILRIEQHVGDRWQAPTTAIAGCASARATTLVTLAPNQPYTATLRATGDNGAPGLTPGTYRLALTWFKTRSFEDFHGTAVYSESIAIRDCVAAATA